MLLGEVWTGERGRPPTRRAWGPWGPGGGGGGPQGAVQPQPEAEQGLRPQAPTPGAAQRAESDPRCEGFPLGVWTHGEAANQHSFCALPHSSFARLAHRHRLPQETALTSPASGLGQAFPFPCLRDPSGVRPAGRFPCSGDYKPAHTRVHRSHGRPRPHPPAAPRPRSDIPLCPRNTPARQQPHLSTPLGSGKARPGTPPPRTRSPCVQRPWSQKPRQAPPPVPGSSSGPPSAHGDASGHPLEPTEPTPGRGHQEPRLCKPCAHTPVSGPPFCARGSLVFALRWFQQASSFVCHPLDSETWCQGRRSVSPTHTVLVPAPLAARL